VSLSSSIIYDTDVENSTDELRNHITKQHKLPILRIL
jgi:hypothetical protein